MARILFLTSAAPEKAPFSTTEKRPPLGIGSMISILRRKGHNVHFIDRYLDPSEDPFDYVVKNRIAYVGIYTNTVCFNDSRDLIIGLDRMRDDGKWVGKIIVGGPHASVASDSIPMVVDHVVIGEGEKAIQDILEGREKERMVCGGRLTQQELDATPFQPWDIFTKMEYDYSCEWIDAEPVFVLNTSRGCPYQCSFCSVHSVWGRKYIPFSAKRVVDEIEYLVDNHGARGIYFREDNFTVDMDRVREICHLLKVRKIDISWACETRVDNLDKPTIKRMSEAGCKAFYLGVESGSPRMLKLMNKRIEVEDAENVIRWGKEFGIRSYCSLITGLPGETYADYVMTERMMRKLKPYAYSYNVFVGIPYSDLYWKIHESKTYERMDDLGLLYMPGFDVRVRFFYGKDVSELTDMKFDPANRTDYDRRLLRVMPYHKLKTLMRKIL